MQNVEIPAEIKPVLTHLKSALEGNEYIWEPSQPHAYVRVVVAQVVWNGEEFFVQTKDAKYQSAWNELSRFLEAIAIKTTAA